MWKWADLTSAKLLKEIQTNDWQTDPKQLTLHLMPVFYEALVLGGTNDSDLISFYVSCFAELGGEYLKASTKKLVWVKEDLFLHSLSVSTAKQLYDQQEYRSVVSNKYSP